LLALIAVQNGGLAMFEVAWVLATLIGLSISATTANDIGRNQVLAKANLWLKLTVYAGAS